MSQANPTIGANKPGLTYRNEDNAGKQALLSNNKGSTAPSYAVAGTIWLDDASTPWLVKMYDGADWITIGAVNASTNAFTPFLGAGAIKFINYAADTGAADAYAVSPTPAISTYAVGQMVTLVPGADSTGACTLKVSGLSDVNIKLANGSDPHAGAIRAGGVSTFVYNGSNFILLNPVYPFGSAAFVNVLDEDDFSSMSPIAPPSQRSTYNLLLALAQGYDPTRDFDFLEDFVDDASIGVNATVTLEKYRMGTPNITGSEVSASGDIRGEKIVTVSGNGSNAYINSTFDFTQQNTGAYNVQARVRFGVVSNATQGFVSRVGMVLQSVTGVADPTNGIYFRQSHTNNSGRWEAVCRAASTETVVDTGVAASTDYIILDIKVNAANDSVEFYIDDNLVATITSNIPANTTRMRFAAAAVRNAGGAGKTLYVDYFRFYADREA